MSALTDCDKCKKMNNRITRQFMGCGYEEPIESARPWQPPSGKVGYQHGDLEVCAGYVSKLPEVVEAGRAWLHWSKGQLAVFTGPQPTDAMLAAVEIIDGEFSAVSRWAQTPAAEGGGGK